MKNITRLLILVIFITILSCYKKPNDHYIEIQGKKQHVLTLGKGKPIVVFITGGGSYLTHYDSVQKAISKITKTFSYDKPGIGKSEMIDVPRTIENMTVELEQLLEKEGIDEPIILVGHSLGGFVARYFIHLYPEKVVGMVLIDPSNEYLLDEINKIKTKKEREYIDSLFMNSYESLPIGTQMESKYGHNRWDSTMRTFKIKTDIPITLIESNKVVEEAFMTTEIINIKKKVYRDFQKKIPQVKIISTDKSGHFIQISEPNLIIDEVKKIFDKVR